MYQLNGKDTVYEEELLSWYSCPQCDSSVTGFVENCPSCGQPLSIRVCPYCDSVIPKESDPCEVCGRWEPAEEIYINPKFQREERIASIIVGIIIFLMRLFLPRSRR
jgi:hypothetical protein